jgi:molybdopterin converting factor small subunit
VARVVLTGNLRRFVGDAGELEIEGENIRQILTALGKRFPELAPHLEEGIAVAVDGTIYQDTWFEAVGPDSEVHLMPAIGGG